MNDMEAVRQQLGTICSADCLGRLHAICVVDYVDRDMAYVTAFRNRDLDDPLGLKLPIDHFPLMYPAAKDEWFTISFGNERDPEGSLWIESLPENDVRSAASEYERLMRELPDDF